MQKYVHICTSVSLHVYIKLTKELPISKCSRFKQAYVEIVWLALKQAGDYKWDHNKLPVLKAVVGQL